MSNSFGIYTYVGNDPTNRTDPKGLYGMDDPMWDQFSQAVMSMTPDQRLALGIAGGAAAVGGIVALGAVETSAGAAGATIVGNGLRGPAVTGAIAGKGASALVKMTIEDAQFGAKAGSHMKDFGLDVTSASDRAAFRQTIEQIGEHPDEVVNGTFSGQAGGMRGDVVFRIKGQDVVVTTRSGKFVTVLKNGINSTSVQNALKAAKQCTGSRVGYCP